MPVDLTGPRRTFTEKVLLDRCTVSRNPEGTRNASFDDQTGDYVDRDGDQTVLATGVPCKAKEASLQETPATVGAIPVVDKLWSVKLDYTLAPEMQIGDEITFDSSEDSQLEGETLKVIRVYTGTLRVAREVQCTRRVSGVGRS